jgi:hypothetical protein
MPLFVVDSYQHSVDFLPESELQQPVQVTGVIRQVIFKSIESHLSYQEKLETLIENIEEILEEFQDSADAKLAINEIKSLVEGI